MNMCMNKHPFQGIHAKVPNIKTQLSCEVSHKYKKQSGERCICNLMQPTIFINKNLPRPYLLGLLGLDLGLCQSTK